jgi:hypothetical protein
LKTRAMSPTPRLSPQSHNFLTSKMLLTPQNLSYLEQKFHQRNNSIHNNSFSDPKISENLCKNGSSSSATSLFTIDSILSKQSRIVDRSPSTSPISDNLFTTNKNDSISPSRLAPAGLFNNHAAAAGLHITHLASNFGSPDFLGKQCANIKNHNLFAHQKKIRTKALTLKAPLSDEVRKKMNAFCALLWQGCKGKGRGEKTTAMKIFPRGKCNILKHFYLHFFLHPSTLLARCLCALELT